MKRKQGVQLMSLAGFISAQEDKVDVFKLSVVSISSLKGVRLDLQGAYHDFEAAI